MAIENKPDARMPELAYGSARFLESADARALRILAEYFDPLAHFRKAGVQHTVVFFGSARILSREAAVQNLRDLELLGKQDHAPGLEANIKRARMSVHMSRYYEEARELSRLITEWARKHSRHPCFLVVCSGGGPGIMEAANRGAHEAGGTSIGLSIQLPHEQRPNPYITPELNFCFHYFFMRKLWFAQMAKALIVFPGGFGTMDELWEMLTLLQTGKLSSHHLILIYGRRYWDQVLNWKAMLRWGTISAKEYKLLQFADTVDEAFDRLREDLKFHDSSAKVSWG